jgi:hypothetical protein
MLLQVPCFLRGVQSGMPDTELLDAQRKSQTAHVVYVSKICGLHLHGRGFPRFEHFEPLASYHRV